MTFVLFRSAAVAALCSASVVSLSASEFATTIVQANLGPNANPSFPPANLLGGPLGGGLTNGSVDVVVLGTGGSITVGFNVTIQDGPGADFLAFENGFSFVTPSDIFAEVAFVEVSSDGVNFARFPSRYGGPPVQQPPFGTLPMGTFAGLVGGMPGIANVATNVIPPEDPVRAGGEAFDLAELATDPLVVGGFVDLSAITQVRFVDAPEGVSLDSLGNPIWDHGGASGSADLDAVVVVNHPATATPNQPVCDLAIDSAGFIVLRLGDQNGFLDLDLTKLRASFNLVEFPFFAVLPVFVPTSFDGSVYELKTVAPVVGAGITGAFAVSAADFAGGFSGDQVMIQG